MLSPRAERIQRRTRIGLLGCRYVGANVCDAPPTRAAGRERDADEPNRRAVECDAGQLPSAGAGCRGRPVRAVVTGRHGVSARVITGARAGVEDEPGHALRAAEVDLQVLPGRLSGSGRPARGRIVVDGMARYIVGAARIARTARVGRRAPSGRIEASLMRARASAVSPIRTSRARRRAACSRSSARSRSPRTIADCRSRYARPARSTRPGCGTRRR